MARERRFAPVKDGIDAGLAKLRKYYRDMDSTDAYFNCLRTSSLLLSTPPWLITLNPVLDPTVKDA